METIGVKPKAKVVDLSRSEGIAGTITETKITCSLNEKDYYLYYLFTVHPGRMLVFCNSIDCVRRLMKIFDILECRPYALHAQMQQKQRLKHLDRFSSNEKSLLIATDVAARGLDIPNIYHVIHYQVPRTSESYVHRSGRTARALKEGLTVMFMEPTEVSNYRKLCRTLGREKDLPDFPIDHLIMSSIKQRVDLAVEIDANEHLLRRKTAENSWLKKTAEEMDIDLDEHLLNDMGDTREQSQQNKLIKIRKKQLATLMGKEIVPGGVTGLSLKYPVHAGIHLDNPLAVPKPSAVELAKSVRPTKRNLLKPPKRRIKEKKKKYKKKPAKC